MKTQPNDFHPINVFYLIYYDNYKIYCIAEMTQQTLSTELRICLHAVLLYIDTGNAARGICEKHKQYHDIFTLNTSEKKPEPIFSQIKSSIRARLDTAFRSAR